MEPTTLYNECRIGWDENEQEIQQAAYDTVWNNISGTYFIADEGIRAGKMELSFKPLEERYYEVDTEEAAVANAEPPLSEEDGVAGGQPKAFVPPVDADDGNMGDVQGNPHKGDKNKSIPVLPINGITL